MRNLIIREAIGYDAENILEYCKIVGGETDYMTYGSEGLSLSVEEERKILENTTISDRSIFLVAELDKEIIGIGNISTNKSERMKHKGMLGIIVKKKYRNKGVGSLLMKSLINFAKDINLEIIELKVINCNKRAINLYDKFGFKKTGVLPADMKIDGMYYDTDYMILDLR
ncbi:GNAT family N-acetyltransferase [Anaerococcus urinomassiliensis]|uniref:GNAT family N-acetyltransferase n=1 Tax=Anaerococcus urinomassiliensis TaxID=1745712 RepID=UPI0009402292|nr:GNAT family N-acetyltransferase [Anaerococcus urinomassiliensis]